MATFDASSASPDIGAVTSVTLSHTVGALTSGALFVAVSTRSGANNPVTGITYNGVAMTLVPSSAATSSGRFLNTVWYRLAAPASGAHNIIVSFTGTTTGGAVYGLSFDAVDQTTPAEAAAVNNNVALAPPWTAAPTTITNNAWVATTMYNSAPGPITPSNGETSRATTIIGAGVLDDIAGVETKGPITPAGSTTTGWTDGTANTNEFALSSIVIKPTAGAPVSPPVNPMRIANKNTGPIALRQHFRQPYTPTQAHNPLAMNLFTTNNGVNLTDSQFLAQLAVLTSVGINDIRMDINSYDASAAITSTQHFISLAVAQGFRVIWGVSGYFPMTATLWTAFSTSVQTQATWAQANGVAEFIIGNEEEYHVDGTTLTIAQVEANLEVLATTIKGIFTSGPVAYNTSTDFLTNWVALGIGSLDRIGWNVYSGGSDIGFGFGFQGRIDTMVATWGNRAYLSEFAPDYISLNDFSQDESAQALRAAQMLAYAKNAGISKAYYFAFYDDSTTEGPAGFGLLKTSGYYRQAWYALINQPFPINPEYNYAPLKFANKSTGPMSQRARFHQPVISPGVILSNSTPISVSDTTTTSETVAIAITAVAPLAVSTADTTVTSESINPLIASLINVFDTTVATDSRTNFVTNPSIEAALTGDWTGIIGATVTQSASQALFATHSLSVVATASGASGARYSSGGAGSPTTLIAGATYVASGYVIAATGGDVGKTVAIHFSEIGGGNETSTNVTLTSSWQRVSTSHTVVAAGAGAGFQIDFREDNGTAASFFVDGVQFEYGVAPTAYFDGSMPGVVWSGTANDSASLTSGGNVTVSELVNVGVSDTTSTSEAVTLLLTSFIGVSDTTTTSESVVAQIAAPASLTISVADTAATAEQVALLEPDGVQVSDTTTTSESVTVLIPFLLASVSDTAVTSETAKAEMNDQIAAADTTATSEAVTIQVIGSAAISDTTSTNEAITLLVTNAISISDTTVTSENILVQPQANVSVSDLTTTSESVTVVIGATQPLTINVSDTTVTSEGVVVFGSVTIAVSDTTITSEAITPSIVSFVNVSDSTTTSEALSRVVVSQLGVSDATATSESVQLLVTTAIAVADTTVTSESVTVLLPNLNISVSDTTVTTEQLALLDQDGLQVNDVTTTSEAIGLMADENIAIVGGGNSQIVQYIEMQVGGFNPSVAANTFIEIPAISTNLNMADFDGNVTVYFEANIFANSTFGAHTVTAELYNHTDSSSVVGSQISTSKNTGDTDRVRSGAITLPASNKVYTVRLKLSDSFSPQGYILGARIIVYQSGTITKTQIHQELGLENGSSSTSTTNTVPQMEAFAYAAANYDGTVSVRHDAVLIASAGNTSSSSIYDVTAASVVSGSVVNSTSTTAAIVSSGAITLTDGHTYHPTIYVSAGGVVLFESNKLVFTITGSPTKFLAYIQTYFSDSGGSSSTSTTGFTPNDDRIGFNPGDWQNVTANFYHESLFSIANAGATATVTLATGVDSYTPIAGSAVTLTGTTAITPVRTGTPVTMPVGTNDIDSTIKTSSASFAVENYKSYLIAQITGIGAGGGNADTTTTIEAVNVAIADQISVSDTTTTSEQVIVQIVPTIPVSDTINTSESISVVIASPGNVLLGVSDSTSTSEQVAVQIVAQITVNDTTSTSENVAQTLVSLINVSDTTATSEALTLLELALVAVSDSTSTSESVTITAALGNIVTSDTTVTAEAVSLQVGTAIAVADTTTTSEAVKANIASFINVSDTTITSEALNDLVVDGLSVNDTTATAEQITVQIITNLAVSDTTITSENVVINETSAGTDAAVVSDTTTTSEQVTLLVGVTAAVSDTTATTEAVNVTLVDNVAVNDGTTTSEAINLAINSQIATSDTTITSENVTLTLADNVSVADTTITAESVVVAFNSNITASDTTATSESVSVVIQQAGVSLINISDTTITSEAVTVVVPFLPLAVSDLTITSESIKLLDSLNIAASDTPIISESTTVVQQQAGLDIIVESDTVTTAEQVTLALSYQINVADSTTTSEQISVAGADLILASDTTNTSEQVKLLVESNVRASDTATTSEQTALNAPLTISVADTAATSEAIRLSDDEGGVNVSDTTATTEAVNVTVVETIAVADTTVTTEQVKLTVALNIGVSDITTTSEAITVNAQAGGIAVSDSTITAENITLLVTSSITVQDTTVTNESIHLTGTLLIAVSDSTHITEFLVMNDQEGGIVVSDSVATSEHVSLRLSDYQINASDHTVTSEALAIRKINPVEIVNINIILPAKTYTVVLPVGKYNLVLDEQKYTTSNIPTKFNIVLPIKKYNITLF